MIWLVANTAVAAALAVVVLGIGRWLRPAPAIMHGLWLVVMLKLVTPPLFEVPVDLGWLRTATADERGERPAERVGESVASPVAIAAVEPTSPLRLEPGASAPRSSTIRPATAAPWHAPASTLSPWLIVWGAGAGAMVLAFTIGVVCQRRRQLGLAPVAPSLSAEVAKLADRLGVTPPELRDDPAAPAPYVWSLGRARLVLPVRRLLAVDARGRAAVLAHELAHLRRGDHWVARAEVVLAVLLWWHPLFWFAQARMRAFCELACDAIAVTTVPGASLAYATVLVDAAARPNSATPAMTVLASRPAARAAFERRLNMILNETPHRASRVWCVPFAALVLGLFAVPTAAQERQRDPDPIRIEVRVNGERVEQLSSRERRALLEMLLRSDEGGAVAVGEKEHEVRKDRKPERQQQRQQDRKPPQGGKKARQPELEASGLELPSAGALRGLIGQGLGEARREIKADKDLRELGITDEVLAMLEGIEQGEGIEGSLDAVVRAAMKGAGKMVMKELADDADLKKLGLTDGISRLVLGFLESERNQEIVGDLARQAIEGALRQARAEIRADSDLKKLGIAGDVEALIDTVVGGGNFEGDLEKIIEKAMAHAMQEVGREIGGGKDSKPERRRTPRARREVR